MSAMDNATRNAGDMIRRQTLTYNRTRQAMITKELIEIISGAESAISLFEEGHDGKRSRTYHPSHRRRRRRAL